MSNDPLDIDGTCLSERYAWQDKEKRKAGRYNLEEAAKLIAASGEGREELILVKLTSAAGSDSLSTYMPGSKAKNEYRIKLDRFKTPDTFYDECYWDDLNKWLEDNEPRITFRFPQPCETEPGTAKAQAAPAKPLQRTLAQDTAILTAIKQAGYDPLALPKNEPGKPGVKSEIRDALNGNSLFVGTTVFRRAWERLRQFGDIADKV
ncbi:hypothetical protein BH11PSE12_BH11PSE12_20480 [soil metagenome]